MEAIARRESRASDQPWVHVDTREVHALCNLCAAWVSSVFDAATRDRVDGPRPMGAPLPVGMDGIATDHCNFCRAATLLDAFILDLVPATRGETVRRHVYRHVGQARQYRLCLGCWTWCRSILADDSALRGNSERQLDGRPGQWAGGAAFDTLSIALMPEDDGTLAEVVEAMGRSHAVIAPNALTRGLQSPDHAVFLGARAFTRAAGTLRALPPEALRRIVVVSRLDAVPDTIEALKMGAGDFLTSPLTSHQVAAALERVARPVAERRDKRTGLPVLERGTGKFGFPGHLVTVAVQGSEELLTAAWILRRFLRGYDHVGVDAEGRLTAVVFCPGEHVRAVLTRLRTLLPTNVRLGTSGRWDNPAIARERAA